MKLFVNVIAAAFVTSLLAGPAAAADGKKVFTDYKCNSCHTVKSKGIGLAGDKPEKEAPDLSKSGAKHDKRWFAGYLLKKVDKDGKKHDKRFSGPKEDLKALAIWLETLK